MGVWCDVAFTTRPWKLSGRQGRSSVVMVAYNDALAYAQWAGRRLPTEAKFEYAARGGVPNSTYAWGAEVRPDGRLMANTWQARFPYLNTGADGWIGISPVGAFPVNNWGLADMIGNVREWTSTYYAVGDDRPRVDELSLQDGARRGDAAVAPTTCCAATAGLALSVANSTESTVARRSAAPGEVLPRRVLKGGPHLCAPEYCLRYRPAARSPQSIESATTHVGFRCAATVAA
jgi:sulfatase modifying factor 1